MRNITMHRERARPKTFSEGSPVAVARKALAPRLAVVVPCFNEVDVLPETARRLEALLDELAAGGRIAGASQIVFVDDGSRDGTWELIENLAATDSRVCGIKLSRNRGHQNALLAGLMMKGWEELSAADRPGRSQARPPKTSATGPPA